MEKKIFDILANANEEILTYTGSNMVDDELVDSFELISIISQLEDAFDIEIDAEDVNEENFGNKGCIVALIKRLTEKAE